MSQTQHSTQEEWLKILGKGMVTLPKKWRDDLGITEGDIVKAKKEGNRVIIEQLRQTVPYRIYSAEEMNAFLKDDALPAELSKKIDKHLNSLKKP